MRREDLKLRFNEMGEFYCIGGEMYVQVTANQTLIQAHRLLLLQTNLYRCSDRACGVYLARRRLADRLCK